MKGLSIIPGYSIGSDACLTWSLLSMARPGGGGLPRRKWPARPPLIRTADVPGSTIEPVAHAHLQVLSYNMNADYYIQRLLGRATCRLGSRARLMRTARIRNIRGESDCIAIGANSIIRGELLTFAHGGKIEIGSWCYLGESSRIWSGSLVQIGDRVLIAHNVNI